jgi:hypothetical protein
VRARLDLTSGQVWTLSLGLLLGVLLLATSVPPVWERRGLVAPAAAQVPPPVAVAPPAGGLVTGLLPPPAPPVDAPLLEPAPLPDAPLPDAPLALPEQPSDLSTEPAPAPAPAPAAPAPPGVPAAAPLRVVEAGYTSSGAEPGLPEDGLPVSARLGERLSTVHVRLTGEASTLTVPLSAAPGASLRPRTRAYGPAASRPRTGRPSVPGPACPFDQDDCVDGVVGPRRAPLRPRPVPRPHRPGRLRAGGRPARQHHHLPPHVPPDPRPEGRRMSTPPLPGLPSRGRTYAFMAGVVATTLTLAVALPLALGDRPDDAVASSGTEALGAGATPVCCPGGPGRPAAAASAGVLLDPVTGQPLPAAQQPGAPGAAAAPQPGSTVPRQGQPAAPGAPGGKPATRTASDQGITPDAVKVGIFLIDFSRANDLGASVGGYDPATRSATPARSSTR